MTTDPNREMKRQTDLLQAIHKDLKSQTQALQQLMYTLIEIGLIMKHHEDREAKDG